MTDPNHPHPLNPPWLLPTLIWLRVDPLHSVMGTFEAFQRVACLLVASYSSLVLLLFPELQISFQFGFSSLYHTDLSQTRPCEAFHDPASVQVEAWG